MRTCVFGLILSLLVLRADADLFVQSPVSTTVGVPTNIDYISTNQLPTAGSLHKVVLIIDDWVETESFTPSGSLTMIFENPGQISYLVRTYGVDGRAIDTIERSITVFGVGMTSPADNSMVPLGSSVYLHAEAVFADKAVERVEFEISPAGLNQYSAIPGSSDAVFPFSYLYEPMQVGLWEIRAVAHHPGGGVSQSQPITLQASPFSGVQNTHVTILDPASGTSVQAGIERIVNVDVSTRSGPVRGVSLYVDGEQVQSSEGLNITFPFQFTWLPRRPGPYTLVAIAIDNHGRHVPSAPVHVIASDDRPSVSMILPSEGSVLIQGKRVPLLAVAAGQGGARERVGAVEFLVDGNAIPTGAGGSQTRIIAEPFASFWTPEVPGTYFLQARVFDSITGSSFQSAAYTITVLPASQPVASIVAPYSGDQFMAGETVALRATGMDEKGLIQSIAFLVNEVQVGTGTLESGTFNLDYVFPGSGLYSIRAIATNDAGRQVLSPSVSVTVLPRSVIRPQVVLVDPAGGETYHTGWSVRIQARANDADGHVEQVQFLVNRRPHGDPVTEYPFISDAFRFPSSGTYLIEAVAIDNDGNRSVPASTSVKVADPVLVRPVVTITNPLDQAVLDVGNQVFFEASAHDADGTIKEVVFAVNGQQIGEPDRAYPYQSEFFEITSPGIHRVTVYAVDNDGNFSLPASIVFFAVPPVAPEPELFNPLGNNQDFLVQLFLDLFGRGPTQSEMHRYLERLEFNAMTRAEVVAALYGSAEFKNLLLSHSAYHAVIGSWPSPIEFNAALQGLDPIPTPPVSPGVDDVGNTFATARHLGSSNGSFSGVLETLGDVDVFAFTVVRETLVTISTTGATDTVGSLYDSGGTMLEYDDDSGAFFNFAIQRALIPGNYYVAVSGWAGFAGAYTLNLQFGDEVALPQSSNLSNAALNATIRFLFSSQEFLNRHGPLQDLDSSDINRRNLFTLLYSNRFGRDPSLQQQVQASNRMVVALSPESFTASFLRNDRVGMTDYIYGLPNVQGRDNAAFLIRALLKTTPGQQRIDSLKDLSIKEQAAQLLADPEYLARFDYLHGTRQTRSHEVSEEPSHRAMSETVQIAIPDRSPENLLVGQPSPFESIPVGSENGWKYVDWFGWVSDSHYPWVFHEHLGWIHVRDAGPDSLWLWEQRLEWTYTERGVFPYVYRYSDGQWILINAGEIPGDWTW